MTQSPSPSSHGGSHDPDTGLELEPKKPNKIKSSLHTLPPVIAILADTGAAVFYVLGVTSLGDKPKALIGLGVVGALVSLAYLIAAEKRIYWLGTTALGLGLGLICLGIVSESSAGSAGFQSPIQPSLPLRRRHLASAEDISPVRPKMRSSVNVFGSKVWASLRQDTDFESVFSRILREFG
jgi:hypothetical protein